jgi:hypothetical protein
MTAFFNYYVLTQVKVFCTTYYSNEMWKCYHLDILEIKIYLKFKDITKIFALFGSKIYGILVVHYYVLFEFNYTYVTDHSRRLF